MSVHRDWLRVGHGGKNGLARVTGLGLGGAQGQPEARQPGIAATPNLGARRFWGP